MLNNDATKFLSSFDIFLQLIDYNCINFSLITGVCVCVHMRISTLHL